MTVHMDADSLASASVDLRPHCQSRSACKAKTPGKHCTPCMLVSPDRIARISATRRAQGAARMAEFMAQTKQCENCGATFHPTKQAKMHRKAWDARRYCGRACAGPSVMRSPEIKAKHRHAVKALFDDPEYRARHAASAAINALKASKAANPKKSAETRSRRAIGWIPADMRKPYVRLRERLGAEKAKTIMRERLAEVGRQEVLRRAQAMREKHQRDLASRY